jgi:RNA polymerase sigma-70 factor (ECF subfamily)
MAQPASPADAAASAAEDLVLMQGVAESRPEALGALYDRHAPALLGVCLRLLRDRSEAEDVIEEVFIEIWQKSGRYDADRASPLAYLVTVARSRAFDRLRRRRREERLRAGHAVETLASGAAPERAPDAPLAGSPLGHALASEQRGHVLRALERLSPAQREVVELSFLDGLTHGEIAERLGAPLGTVKSWIRRGLAQLRESLRVQYGDGEVA